MYNHAPKDDLCPFCLLSDGIKNKHGLSGQTDIFYHKDDVTAFISSPQRPNNLDDVPVIPNQHDEMIFNLPTELCAKIFSVAPKIALATKDVYGYDGVSTRQYNKFTGTQDAWHYHKHVFPRHKNDNLCFTERFEMADEERAQFAHKLKDVFEDF